MKKIFLAIFALFFIASCAREKPTNKVDIDKAVEIVCPGVPPTLVLRASKEELREALRKQYSHDDTRDTVLKLPNKANVMIPIIRPKDLDKCIVRDLPQIKIPASMGY